MSLGARLARALVRCYPPAFRARHGQSLAQTVEADWRRQSAVSHRIRLVANVAAAGLRERRHLASRPHSPRRFSMTGLGSDVHHAWRTLTHRPLFAAITIATLALGLGATIAMFTVADAVLLRPLPYPHDERLVVMTEHQQARNLTGVSFPALAEWRAFPELESVAGHEIANLLFRNGDAAERLTGVSASPEFFDTLGARPALGRTTHPGDPELDPSPKIVLGHDVWQRFFNGDAGVVGRAVVLEGKTYQIIGVMPAGFAYPSEARFWITLPPAMRMVHEERSLRFLEVIARLKPGADVGAVEARLAAWKRQDEVADPSGKKWRPEARSLRDETVGAVRAPLQVVFLGVGFLLLVACANAAALVLAHGRTKLRDLAVQSALGANRGRLVRQMLVEGLMLSLAGSAVAILIASATRNGIVALSANQIPRVDEIHFGLRTIGFAVGAAVLATALVTLGPALVLTRGSHTERLQRGSRSATASGAGKAWFGPLVAVEFALALVLSMGAGLLLASYRHLNRVDSGFQAAHVVAAKVAVPLTRDWIGDGPNRRLNAALLEALRAQPGVQHAALVARLPLSEVGGGTDLWPTGDDSRKTPALLQLTSEDYFETMGSRIASGRDFSPQDTDAAPPAIIVNDLLANTLWPGQSAIGKSITYQFMKGPVTATVIGVVPAMRYNDLQAEIRPEVYVTFRQALNTPVTVVARTSLDTAAAAAALRFALGAADATHNVTMIDIATLDARLARVLARPRFYLVMVGTFAVVAFMLAALGVYGTMMFWVGERWREFGIRMALGARAGDVTRLLVRHGLFFAGAGIIAGLACAAAGRRIIAALLFQVAPTDPVIIASTVALLAAAAVLAALVPARRVARVDPVTTLRAD